MVTLNNVVQTVVEGIWRKVLIADGDHYQYKDLDTELALDPLIPEILPETPDSNPESGPFYNAASYALVELFGEVNRHTKSTKRRVKTELQDSLQIIELAWDGEQLSKYVLQLINRKYQKGSRMSGKHHRYGTLRAGYFLSQIGGEVSIENFSDGLYVVRNVVKIPIQR